MNKVSLAIPMTVKFKGGGVGWPAEYSHTQNMTESLANQLCSLLALRALEETAPGSGTFAILYWLWTSGRVTVLF